MCMFYVYKQVFICSTLSVFEKCLFSYTCIKHVFEHRCSVNDDVIYSYVCLCVYMYSYMYIYMKERTTHGEKAEQAEQLK